MIYIDVYRQYITVTSVLFSKLLFMLYDFNKSLTTFKLTSTKGPSRFSKPRIVSAEDKQFYVIETENIGNPNKKNLIRYAIGSLDPLIEYLKSKGVEEKDIKIRKHEYPVYDTYPIEINPKFTPRSYQKKYIEKIVSWDGNSILVDLQTGMGKTFIAMASISRMQKRFGILVLPRYIDKWIGDVTSLTNIKKDEILVLQGSKSILKMFMMSEDEILKYKAVILSLKSISLFIKEYLLEDTYSEEGITPERLFELLQLEVIISDEVHQEFHNVFKVMLYSNIRLFIGLTATLTSKNSRLEKMYHILFPETNRISNIVPYNKYISVFSVRYSFKNKRHIRYKTAFGYSQPIFETSILKHSVIRTNYFNMLRVFLEKAYLKRRKEGDKVLVFMRTIDMCRAFIEFLKSLTTFDGCVISKYTEEDDYDVLFSSDIIVSTLGSAGTAVDIPNLIAVLQTDNIDSVQSNIQSLGRLREIKGRNVYFIYFWTSDIPAHKIYNRNRHKLFSSRVKSITSVDYLSLI